jgi:hypothetical protein
MSVTAQQIQAQLQASRQQAAPLTMTFFIYDMFFAAVASAAVGNATLQIQADSDFWVIETAVTAIDTVTTLAVASAALIQLNDTGSGSTLFNIPIPITNAFGTAQLPYLLPIPRQFSANSTITGTLQNQVTANATDFHLSFMGFKVYGK